MWTFTTDRDEHLDEHNQYDHADLSSLTEGKVLGVESGIIKQVAALLLTGGTMAGDLDMGEYSILNALAVHGRTNQALNMEPGAGQDFIIKDDTGAIRFRLNNNLIGDILFYDAAGVLTFFWDESSGNFRHFSDVTLEGNDIVMGGGSIAMNAGSLTELTSITGRTTGPLVFQPDAALALQLKDGFPHTRIAIQSGQPTFFFDTGGNPLLGVRDDRLDLYNKNLDRVGQILGSSTEVLGLRAGATQSIRLQDDIGAYRIRVDPNSVGDIMLIDNVGTYRLQWDQSRGTWRMSSNLDMESNNIIGLTSVTGAGSTFTLQPAAGQVLRLLDDTGVKRFEINVNATGSMVFYDAAGLSVA